MSNDSYMRSYWRFQLHRATGLLKALLKNRMSAVGLIILVIASVVALTAPLLTPYNDIQAVSGPVAQPEWVMSFPDGYYLSKNLVAVSDPSFSSPAAVQALTLTGSHSDLSSLVLSFAPRVADSSTHAVGSLQLSHPGQGVGQARYRRSRQPAAVGNFQIAEPRLVALEAAQHVERARHHLNDIPLAGKIAGEHSLLAEPLRTSSHVAPPFRSAE